MISERDVPALLGVIYEAASDFSGWERVLRALAAAFDGNGCVLGISGTGRQFSAYVAPLTEPAFLTAYNAYYHRISPLMPRIKALPAGSVVTDRMVLARSDFVKSEIYNDWILPQGLCNKLYSVLLAEKDQRVMIGLHRTHEFDERDLATCRLLTPHLQRAMQISLRLRRLESDRTSLAETLDRLEEGVVLTDADARPLLINKAAEPMFGNGMVRLAEGRVAGSRPSDTARLQGLIASCGGKEIAGDAGGRIGLACQGGASTVIATVVPTRTELC
jgi:PAS domain-containing protein